MSSGLGSVVVMDRSQAQVVALPADASGLVVGAAGTVSEGGELPNRARNSTPGGGPSETFGKTMCGRVVSIVGSE